MRLTFKLAREGDGTFGGMGVKSIVTYLNAKNIRTRDGGRWGLGALHKVLTQTTYIGRPSFSRPFANTIPRSNKIARNWLINAVRSEIRRSSERCSVCRSSCSWLLRSTKRMVGRVTASPIAGGVGRVVLLPLRVESRRGAVARRVAFRFPSPLIKPDVQISRIRLSDWLHHNAHGGDTLRTRFSCSTPRSP